MNTSTFSTDTLVKIDAFASAIRDIHTLAENTKRPDGYYVLVIGEVKTSLDASEGNFEKVRACARIWLYNPTSNRHVPISDIDTDLISISMDELSEFFSMTLCKISTATTPELEIAVLEKERQKALDAYKAKCEGIDAEIEKIKNKR